ncbi:hypothetical protein Nepgr_018996 [Nepenthes gracilis]|uniref:NAD(+) kinase n=1 Tax=Nepenthes gracilis TaxID=150966 RepID=A0AAD3SUE9_NEPGR|nr:hypothetical protein Nepgr_018996 [Nepenthes gracilis]
MMIEMNRISPASTTTIHVCPYGFSKFTVYRQTQSLLRHGYGFGLLLRRKGQRRLKFVSTAALSKSLSLNFGLDSQTFQFHDVSELRWIGPVPGDIAEVEAYCRIFRAAEHLHATLMDTLCNPVTGECFVSYESSSEEKPFLEDKIVSVLGCMVSLLNKGRQDVLSGRSSIMTSYRVAEISTAEDKLPPLAVFRSEIKRCCESLHVALENYLTNDDRSHDIWRKLQQLKNLCYDLGFPRGDDSPGHMLFANWAPVYFSTTKGDAALTGSDVAFCKGGQLTEDGLKWLLEKGFKSIVDLRAESVKDSFYQAAIDDAIGSGKVELFRLPVEVGTAPSMEQVVKFATLVSDPSRRPIYLHSREGVWRTSGMVSRWRQWMTHSELPLISSNPNHSNGSVAPVNRKLPGHASSSRDKDDLSEEEDELLMTSDEKSNSDRSSRDRVSIVPEKHNLGANGTCNVSVCSQATPLSEVDDYEVSSILSADINPLKSQIPPCNVFSRKEMSSFFKSKKISPSTLFNFRRWPVILPVSREAYLSAGWKSESIPMDSSLSGLREVGSSNGSSLSKNLSFGHQRESAANGVSMGNGSHPSIGVIVDEIGNGKIPPMTINNASTAVSENYSGKRNISETSALGPRNNGESSVVPEDDGLELIEGNMCAAATGVVRIQSRKKAEMFLVRTDGFSCTRERVSESSLAFTHPSTQQQMLMWKSTPRTVLLLKKLGRELIEEAKEVASFLYYQEKMNVLVEPDVHDIFARIPGFGFVHTFYSQDTSDLHEKVDFVACLGGDGVILHASNIFRGAVPPVVSFNLGSLGFLTSHTFEDYEQDLRQIIHGNNTSDGVYITLRMRLRCEIFRNGKAMPGKVFDVLNEVVVDRGSNPYLSKIECYEHNRLITKVQGDGVIIATPTGSTAYSTAAGGSMVHPNVPCMLFTPICPHSLSFRPVILPDSAQLELKIPDDARSNAWVSFDGKRRQQVSRGDSVCISMSQHPLPTVNKSDQTGDWFHSLIRCLNWNERLDQRAL